MCTVVPQPGLPVDVNSACNGGVPRISAYSAVATRIIIVDFPVLFPFIRILCEASKTMAASLSQRVHQAVTTCGGSRAHAPLLRAPPHRQLAAGSRSSSRRQQLHALREPLAVGITQPQTTVIPVIEADGSEGVPLHVEAGKVCVGRGASALGIACSAPVAVGSGRGRGSVALGATRAVCSSRPQWAPPAPPQCAFLHPARTHPMTPACRWCSSTRCRTWSRCMS